MMTSGGKKHEFLANCILVILCVVMLFFLLITTIAGGAYLIALYFSIPFWVGGLITLGIWIIFAICIIALAAYTAADYKL